MPELIAIAAGVAQRPNYGGHVLVILQYLCGFRRLDFDVFFLDRLEPEMIGAQGLRKHVAYLEHSFDPYGIRYSVAGVSGSSVAGLDRDDMLDEVNRASFFLNVMGFVTDPDVLAAARHRVFLDIDPGFGQTWRALGLADVFAGHDDFVTVGLNVGRPGSPVPTCGLDWITAPHPVVLDRCPVRTGGHDFTTIGSWRGPYDPIEYQGRRLGLRAHEFRKFAELPGRVQPEFRVALEIDPGDERDITLLRENGWKLVDPHDVAPDPDSYLDFIRGSAAEFTVAKGVYVDLRTGWLGDRTIAYLASGKPALVQDTGLADHFPVGEGLVTFSTLDEAVAGVESICADYDRHAEAARAIAEEYFDSDKVLTRLLERLGVD